MKICEIARFTDNVAATTAYYRKLLNIEPAVASPDMAIFLCGDVKILIHKTYAPGPGELPCENHVAFAVPDLDAAFAALREMGFAFEVEPATYPWGRSAYLRDPDGQLIELSEGNPESS